MKNGSWGGIGCGGEMVCSWVLYIGQGRLAEAVEERSQWWPVEFNGATVSSLESTLRGGETEGRHHYRRGSGGSMAQDAEAALMTAAGRTSGGGTASDQRREMKEERAEWAG
jgi:predicted DsbA family dithiol-disulfide isomerase